MKDDAKALAAGLYLVATPIGTARDITLRALDVLSSADVIAAEDTRNTRKLMDIHGISLAGRQLVAYHDHNGPAARPGLIEAIGSGCSVAYVSDAGSPLIADPGFDLAKSARQAGFLVTAVPGASSVITALSIAGLPTDRFFFAGFIPNAKGQRKALFAECANIPASLVFFESGKRVGKAISDMEPILGGDREIAICREITKKFEEVRKDTIKNLNASLAGAGVKGEVVLIVDRARASATAQDMNALLQEAMQSMRTKDAAELVATKLGLTKRQVYQAALALKDQS